MADTAIVNITWDDNDGTDVAAGQGTAIVHANTHVITPTGPLEEMVIMVTNTEGSTNAVTVKAGDNPPADAAAQGDKTFTTISATTGRIILPPLSSARFLQDNGTVRITVESGMTGYIMAMQRPRVTSCM
jgi:hypothetical protein